MSGQVGLLQPGARELDAAVQLLARPGARTRWEARGEVASLALVGRPGWPEDSWARAPDGLAAVCHGELFDLPPGRSAAADLLEAYRRGRLPERLARANGVFCLTILDPVSRCVLLATDRYGIKPLYLWRRNGRIRGWSSELKSFLPVAGFDARIDPEAARCFLRFGHMLGDATWLAEVRRAAPAALYSVPFEDAEPEHRHRYWSWSAVRASELSLDEASHELGQRFRTAVERQLRGVDRVSVLLSGGLDSRALLAAASEQGGVDLACFTFGRADSADAAIARQVAAVTGVPHTLCDLHEGNWLEGRREGVWRTDGMFTLLHMHALVAIDRIADYSPLILNGFAGDLVCGGSYLRDGLDRRMDAATARRHFGEFAAPDRLDDPYFDLPRTDPYFLHHRVMRFTAAGSDLLSDQLVHRKPFFDTELMDFLYSLPDAYRRDSMVYGRMLQREFPAWFREIPWEATGRPVGQAAPWRTRAATLGRRLWRRLRGGAAPGSYTAYAEWLRAPGFRRALEPALERGRKQLVALGLEDRFEVLDRAHRSGRSDHSEEIAALATAALWLDRALAEAHRPAEPRP